MGTTVSEDGRQVSVSGASTLGNLWFLREALLRRKSASTLEIGLAYGVSEVIGIANCKLRRTPSLIRTTPFPVYAFSFWSGIFLEVIDDWIAEVLNNSSGFFLGWLIV